MTVHFTTDYKELGYFARTHGSDGQLLLMTEYPLDDFWSEHPVIRYRDERGDLIPARLQQVDKAESDNGNAFFVKLVDIGDRHTAEELKGRTVWMEQTTLDEQHSAGGTVPYDQFEVINEDGKSVGKVVNGFKTSAQHIIEIRLKGGKQIMVPLVEEFIVEADEQNRRLVCRNLEMLKEV